MFQRKATGDMDAPKVHQNALFDDDGDEAALRERNGKGSFTQRLRNHFSSNGPPKIGSGSGKLPAPDDPDLKPSSRSGSGSVPVTGGRVVAARAMEIQHHISIRHGDSPSEIGHPSGLELAAPGQIVVPAPPPGPPPSRSATMAHGGSLQHSGTIGHGGGQDRTGPSGRDFAPPPPHLMPAPSYGLPPAPSAEPPNIPLLGTAATDVAYPDDPESPLPGDQSPSSPKSGPRQTLQHRVAIRMLGRNAPSVSASGRAPGDGSGGGSGNSGELSPSGGSIYNSPVNTMVPVTGAPAALQSPASQRSSDYHSVLNSPAPDRAGGTLGGDTPRGDADLGDAGQYKDDTYETSHFRQSAPGFPVVPASARWGWGEGDGPGSPQLHQDPDRPGSSPAPPPGARARGFMRASDCGVGSLGRHAFPEGEGPFRSVPARERATCSAVASPTRPLEEEDTASRQEPAFRQHHPGGARTVSGQPAVGSSGPPRMVWCAAGGRQELAMEEKEWLFAQPGGIGGLTSVLMLGEGGEGVVDLVRLELPGRKLHLARKSTRTSVPAYALSAAVRKAMALEAGATPAAAAAAMLALPTQNVAYRFPFEVFDREVKAMKAVKESGFVIRFQAAAYDHDKGQGFILMEAAPYGTLEDLHAALCRSHVATRTRQNAPLLQRALAKFSLTNSKSSAPPSLAPVFAAFGGSPAAAGVPVARVNAAHPSILNHAPGTAPGTPGTPGTPAGERTSEQLRTTLSNMPNGGNYDIIEVEPYSGDSASFDRASSNGTPGGSMSQSGTAPPSPGLLTPRESGGGAYGVGPYGGPGQGMNAAFGSSLMSTRALRYYGACLLQALVSLHEAGYVFRDLKLSNVLICDGGRIRLTDFGAAATCITDRPGLYGGVAGTRAYLAPEVLAWLEREERREREGKRGSASGERHRDRPDHYTVTVDSWNWGLVMVELATGWSLKELHMRVMARVCNPKKPQHADLPPDCGLPPMLRQLLLDHVLVKNPKARWPAARIREHPFFADLDWDGLAEAEGPHAHLFVGHRQASESGPGTPGRPPTAEDRPTMGPQGLLAIGTGRVTPVAPNIYGQPPPYNPNDRESVSGAGVFSTTNAPPVGGMAPQPGFAGGPVAAGRLGSSGGQGPVQIQPRRSTGGGPEGSPAGQRRNSITGLPAPGGSILSQVAAAAGGGQPPGPGQAQGPGGVAIYNRRTSNTGFSVGSPNTSVVTRDTSTASSMGPAAGSILGGVGAASVRSSLAGTELGGVGAGSIRQPLAAGGPGGGSVRQSQGGDGGGGWMGGIGSSVGAGSIRQGVVGGSPGAGSLNLRQGDAGAGSIRMGSADLSNLPYAQGPGASRMSTPGTVFGAPPPNLGSPTTGQPTPAPPSSTSPPGSAFGGRRGGSLTGPSGTGPSRLSSGVIREEPLREEAV
ncbi:hypothetical protein HYH03_014103 [Edaphochlamys debaryana]|uniref:Protein kinase domain-containing protein n=1 Tax=Edaphochlamys debaryana TaxID=47281 RepID=A0A835XLY0_9CHLO|nr:hypothetical protein HYH03_014103 [Edaphochlamys debaryana]|eukprot:KAG2487262.1 hypothetical protein HYH03_014103 [Edaphochlamys debaryana]